MALDSAVAKISDINECTQGLHSCNPESESCSNTPGGYDCLCRWGYLYNQLKESCIQNELLMAAEAGQIDVPAHKQGQPCPENNSQSSRPKCRPGNRVL
uniref:EGF-like domain-containing protein n=1 Tax=Timema cristinae TaxID=61476 RepID=A0A7R9CVP1_TIMCR|nr:unnamed protein product [Timema cristinae]